MGLRVWRVGLVVWLAAAPPAAGQLAPIGTPSGMLRVELGAAFQHWDRRFRAGDLESWAADFSSPALGSDRMPFLAEADTRLGRSAGIAGYRLNLGRSNALAQISVDVGSIGLSYGVTPWLTVFGRWPLVRSAHQSAIRLEPGGDAGANPADPVLGTSAGQAEAETFFAQFDAALATLQSRIGSGVYDSDPARRALAEQTLAAGTTLRDDLFAVVSDPGTAAPFLPTSASAAGVAIGSRVGTLQTTLATDLGVTGFGVGPVLAADPLDEDELITYLNSPSGIVAGSTRNGSLTNRGDAEIGAAVTLVDTWDRGSRAGGFRAALEATVRLPTGIRESADNFFDVGTGDAQTDLDLRLVADVGSGRVGARLAGGYSRQFAATIDRRVTPPFQPLAARSTLARVRWDPGDDVTLSLQPFVRLARTFAFQAGITWWSHGADEYSYAGDPLPGIDAEVLAEESKSTATAASIGFTYANPGSLRPVTTGLPLDASLTYERVVAGSEGRVPEVERVVGTVRLYWKPF